MVHSICIWKSEIPSSQLELLTEIPPQVRILTHRNCNNPDFRIQYGFSSYQQKWKSSNILHFCLSKYTNWCTQYCQTSICGHDTLMLSLQNTVFLSTGITISEPVRLDFPTCVLECCQLGCDIIPSFNINSAGRWILSARLEKPWNRWYIIFSVMIYLKNKICCFAILD